MHHYFSYKYHNLTLRSHHPCYLFDLTFRFINYVNSRLTFRAAGARLAFLRIYGSRVFIIACTFGIISNKNVSACVAYLYWTYMW